MTSSAKIAGGDIQLSVDRAGATAELQELRAEVRTTFAGMSDDALRFAQAQDRLDRALKQSNGKITSSVRSAELNLRRVEQEAVRSSTAVVTGANRSASALAKEERSLGGVTRGLLAAGSAGSRLRTAFALGSTSFLGGYGITYLFKQVVDEASNVQEETEKTGVVFGKNAADVQAWSRTLAQSFGIGEGEALKAAGVFGNMLRPLGFGEQAAATMSKRMVELAADMASFNNAKPDQILQALSSGIAGQVRPLRQYGVFLSEARIQEEALADGIAKRGQKLTQAQKVQAAYNIILKDTKLQQGDVARNTESLSVAESKLHAGIQDLEAGIARGLLPQLTALINRGAAWLNQSKNQEQVQHAVVGAAHELEGAVHGVVDVFKLVAPPVRLATKALGGTENAVKLLGLALIALKLRSIAADFGILRTRTLAAGGAAVTAAGEYNQLAAAESRAATSGGGIRGPLIVGAGGGAVFGGGVVDRVGQYTGGGPKPPGASVPGFGFLGSFALALFGAQSDIVNVPQVFLDDKPYTLHIGKPWKPGSVQTVRGKQYIVTIKNGNYYLYSKDYFLIHQPVDTSLSATVGAGPHRTAPSPTTTTTTKVTTPPPLTRDERVALQVQRAQLAVARGDKGAQTQLIAALKAEIDLDRDDEKLQERLVRTDVKHRAEHLQILQRLYADEQSALDQIASLEQKNEASKTAKAKKRAAAKKKAEAERDALIKKLMRGETAFPAPGRYPGESDAEYALRARSAALNKLYKDKIKDATSSASKTKTDANASAGVTAANLAQFLESFRDIVSQYAPNAFPRDSAAAVSSTRLYELVHATRESNRHLADIKARTAFPASGYAVASSEAAIG